MWQNCLSTLKPKYTITSNKPEYPQLKIESLFQLGVPSPQKHDHTENLEIHKIDFRKPFDQWP